jgi:hypothetical protein
MAAISPRIRLRIKLEEATTAAEIFRDDTQTRFDAERRKWKRMSGKRERWEKRIADRVSTMNAAIEAMRAAVSKL